MNPGHIPKYETSRPGSRCIVTAHDTGLFTNYGPLNIKDSTTNRLLLGDTVAEVSVITPGPNNFTTAQALRLLAAKATDIYTYERCPLILDLGLNHTSRWAFIAADFPYPINGMDSP